MTREEVIKRFCELQARVAREIGDYSYAADCFCVESEHKDPATYQNDGVPLAIIEAAVEGYLASRRVERQFRKVGADVQEALDTLRGALEGAA